MAATTVPTRSTPHAGPGGVLGEGVVAGVLGATALAAWFLVVDGIQGVPMLTPSILGSILISGGPDLAGPHPKLAAVGVYTLVHYLLFGIVGVAAAALAHRAERNPAVLLGALLFLVVFQAFALSYVAVFAEALLGTLRWWVILLGNLVAGGVMLAYLGFRHPRMSRALDDQEVFEPRQ